MSRRRSRGPNVEAAITQRLYEDHRDLREKLFQDLRRRHPERPPAEVLQAAQTVLDRILFIAFAEDRGLLPEDTIEEVLDRRDRLHPGPAWQRFCAVFRWIDEGHEARRIPAYGGGLFREDALIEGLDVTDEMCAELGKLAAYNYRDDVSVDALGHLFERSITDLEELRRRSGIAAVPAKTSRRKAEGVFYTPAFITRFLVEQTLGRVFKDRWEAVLGQFGPVDSRRKEGSAAWIAAWTRRHEAYLEELKKLRVLDPACGSGAFLIAAFDALSREYDRVNGELAALNKGQATSFDLTKTVLHNNLFGVDVNAESVEITKLSLWLKTAERGRKLTSLDSNIQWGNSIVTDPTLDAVAFDWQTGDRVKSVFDPDAAPEAAEIHARWREGFDVVIGNPPYVRHELLGKIKDHLEKSYRAYHGMADLFVYFFERGIEVLKPGGRLGFIVANKWLKAGYAESLRRILASEVNIETIVDFGHAPLFPDADAFPCILTLSKPTETPAGSHEITITLFPGEPLDSTAIPEYVRQNSHTVPQDRLTSVPWSLESPKLDHLLRKIRTSGVPLADMAGTKPDYGIKTGFNEAFLVTSEVRNQLVAEDPRSAEVLKKVLRGQDIRRWSAEWDQSWMIFARRGIRIDDYPAVKRHLLQYKEALQPRPRDHGGSSWPGRKPGTYKWYELQDAVDYWEVFDKPKIIWKDLSFHPEFSMDTDGYFTNDLCFVLPSVDPWLLAVLNSPLMWSYLWRTVVHGKDEVLRLKNISMERAPIAPPSREAREQAEPAVQRLIELTKAENNSRAAVLDSLRMQFAVTEPGNKLEDFPSLDPDTFVQEVLKRRAKSAGKLRAADMKALREMYGDEALPLQARRREALTLERHLSALVNDAYGLTPEEVTLLWSTAPPRMPFKPEQG